MRALLGMAGHTVQIAGDGASAIALAREMLAEVVLLDIGLPDIDGYEVARRLRDDDLISAVLVIAVTGWGREADVKKGRDAGIDAHLTKPVDPDRLLELVAIGAKR
jgi:DNA-binding response OmpR family regulator